MSSQVWHDDPRRLGFVLARYKFVAKMFAGFGQVLEVGCADAFASRIVAQEVAHLIVSDFDPVFVDDVNVRQSDQWPLAAIVHDMTDGPAPGRFDGAYAMDVLEHIAPDSEDRFMANIAASLAADGAAIIGTPSLESQTYASPLSKQGHVNCQTAASLRALMSKHFANVFLFSMNDEVVHTGFSPMAHYLIALAVTPRPAGAALTPPEQQ